MDMDIISTSSVFLNQRTIGRRKRKEIQPPASNKDVILYYYPHSYHCQQVLMVLYEKNISFEDQIVDLKLGEQFSEEFLQLNPRAEVPVLVHNLVTIVDSTKIITYLDDNFNQSGDVPLMFPRLETQKHRVEAYYRRCGEVNVTLLTLGSVAFADLNLSPRGVFSNETNRLLLQEYIQHRAAIYRTQAYNFQEHKIHLNDKADDAKQDLPYLTDRKYYETLILSLERLLNDAERELRCRTDPSHPEHGWWLCSPALSAADISFGLILHRMVEIGFMDRICQSRPFVTAYYSRFQRLASFTNATRPEGESRATSFVNILFAFIVLFLSMYYFLRGPVTVSKSK